MSLRESIINKRTYIGGGRENFNYMEADTVLDKRHILDKKCIKMCNGEDMGFHKETRHGRGATM